MTDFFRAELSTELFFWRHVVGLASIPLKTIFLGRCTKYWLQTRIRWRYDMVGTGDRPHFEMLMKCNEIFPAPIICYGFSCSINWTLKFRLSPWLALIGADDRHLAIRINIELCLYWNELISVGEEAWREACRNYLSAGCKLLHMAALSPCLLFHSTLFSVLQRGLFPCTYFQIVYDLCMNEILHGMYV